MSQWHASLTPTNKSLSFSRFFNYEEKEFKARKFEGKKRNF
jgi:hypothetical protein